jgi:arginyl-tRNA synthetase
MSAVPTISAVLTELVLNAAASVGHAGVLADVEPAVPTNNPKFGDYQSNHAFRLGKALRTNPRAVAETVQAALVDHPAVAATAVAGPGFINFTLNEAWLAIQLAAQADDVHGGLVQTGEGSTVVIDYSSPNVAKRMHVGHMRSTIIGNTLDRMHRATGWRVIADNHIGDWGTQFGKLIVAWRLWLDEAAYAEDPIGELERIYVKFGAEQTDAFLAEARAETAKLQSGGAENTALWTRFIQASLVEFDGVYQRLGVVFDETLGESFYNPVLAGVVESLKQAGIAEDSQGAVVIHFGDDAPKGMADTVLVIQKQDGAFLYGTTDLATLQHRQNTWSPKRVLYVTDMRQQLHFRQVFEGWTQWQPASEMELIHTWFGMLKLPEGTMSSRTGNVIRLVDLMDEAVRRARAVVDQKSPDLSDTERAAVAEAVGVAAIRYADLAQNPQSDVTFTWDKMLALEGNTAPYLMYSYARCRSIQRKGELVSPSVEGMDLGADPYSRALGVHLARFPEAVATSLNNYRPNLLADYLFEVANIFNRFYREIRVLSADTPEQRRARLALVEATARVLERGFGLMGIAPLSRM